MALQLPRNSRTGVGVGSGPGIISLSRESSRDAGARFSVVRLERLDRPYPAVLRACGTNGKHSLAHRGLVGARGIASQERDGVLRLPQSLALPPCNIHIAASGGVAHLSLCPSRDHSPCDMPCLVLGRTQLSGVGREWGTYCVACVVGSNRETGNVLVVA